MALSPYIIMNICVVGLGYVGLPLSLQFARCGATVLGLDIDQGKVSMLNEGKSYIKHIAPETIKAAVDAKTFVASTDFSRITGVEAVIICVPTPLNKNREPDISYIVGTGKAIAPHLQQGTLVVLESTTYPGTTDEDLKDVLEQGSGLKAGVDFHLAFSPEREDPGNPHSVSPRYQKWWAVFRPLVLKRPSHSTRWRSRRSCQWRRAG
jgi:UDP-N-acetyl-D-glucosamine dehydrogenase